MKSRLQALTTIAHSQKDLKCFVVYYFRQGLQTKGRKGACGWREDSVRFMMKAGALFGFVSKAKDLSRNRSFKGTGIPVPVEPRASCVPWLIQPP